MTTIGIDSGSQNTKAVALRDGVVIGKAKRTTEFDVLNAAKETYRDVLEAAGLKEEQIDGIAATGIGRSMIDFANISINEGISAVKGARAVKKDCSMVIDMGAESYRVLRLNGDGSVKAFEVNDKCASGGGLFLETVARALEIDVTEMGEYSLRHTKNIQLDAQCVVFVESEVISLIHSQESIENIAYGVHAGISSRISAMIRRVGITDGVVFEGGPAKNQGLVRCLEDEIGKKIYVPKNPDFISAYGAALFAAEQA